MQHITHHKCPACGSSAIRQHVKCKDHLVSNLLFPIEMCSKCGLGLTQNAPTPSHIGDFYKSENYISHTDTKQGFINSLYHKVRGLMLVRKQKLAERLIKGRKGKLLDIGCGTGYFIGHMKRKGWEVHGIEPDADARQIASEQLGQKISDSKGLFELSNANNDVITMWHVLEHVHDLNGYLLQIKTLLKEGGYFIVAVPNHQCYDAKLYKENWAAYDVPRHLWHFSPHAIKQLIEPRGFRLISKKRMPFDPFYISIMSEKNRNKSFAFVFGICNGAISYAKSLFNINKSSSLIYVFKKY